MISPSGAAGCTPASRRLRQNSNLPFFHHRDVGLWSNLSKSDLWVLPTFSDKPRFRWAMGQKVCWGFSKENQPAEDVIHNGWLIFTIWIIIFGYGSRLLTRWPKMFVILRGNQPFFVISTNERIICFFFGCGVHMPGMIYDNDHQLQSNGIQNHQLFSSWSPVVVPTVSRTMWESFENQSTKSRDGTLGFEKTGERCTLGFFVANPLCWWATSHPQKWVTEIVQPWHGKRTTHQNHRILCSERDGPTLCKLVWLVVSTNPSEKSWSSSVGMIFHSQLNGKSFKIPWFQSPPTRWLLTINHH